MLKNVLSKLSLGGMITMVRLGKNGEFEVTDNGKNILAIYAGEEKELFKDEIGVFNLGLLLDMLRATTDPKITYKDGVVYIKEGGKVFEYMAAEPSVIYTAYNPEKAADHIKNKLAKIGKATKIKLEVDQVQEILKGAAVLKDASVVFFEGSILGIGKEHENKYRVQLDKDVKVEEKVTLPKRELQAILTACEGDVTIEIRGEKAPVVFKEQDITFVLNQME